MSKLSIYFWDVQHGHAAYVRTPNGRHLVFDLGIGDYSLGDESFSPLKHLKNSLGVKQLDYVCISHPHLDHIDDILNFDLLNPKVLLRAKHLTNEEVMRGVRDGDKDKFDKYCEINSRYSEPVLPNSENSTVNPANWGGVRIKSFTPISCPRDNFNNHSIVVVLTYLNVKVVIPGDNQRQSFTELMLRDDFKIEVAGADILLAPHHGRESGYDADFVGLVNPRVTVVSDGSFCDTSANARYSAKSSGWEVASRSSGVSEMRKCLTTNSDGHIEVLIWPDAGTNQTYLSLTNE